MEMRLKEYEKYLYESEKSSLTVEKYIRDVTKFVRFAKGKEVNKELVLKYKAFLGEQYALSSANSMLAALNSFFRFMSWEDLCVRQYRVQKKVYSSEMRELTKTEYYRLIQTAYAKRKKRLALLLQTICGTGIRISELQYITVEAVQRGEAVVSCKAKVRVVFIVSALQEKLLEYAREEGIESGMIFVTKRGAPMNRSNIWHEMRSLCVLANVPQEKVYPHNLRHLFARTFYEMEKDIAKLADILGHSNINTTRIYIATTGAEHRKKMEDMGLVFNKNTSV